MDPKRRLSPAVVRIAIGGIGGTLVSACTVTAVFFVNGPERLFSYQFAGYFAVALGAAAAIWLSLSLDDPPDSWDLTPETSNEPEPTDDGAIVTR